MAFLFPDHDPAIVLLSLVVIYLASYTALNLAGWALMAPNARRPYWLGGAAAALGGGIWAMHFIAMLAFDIGIPMRYGVTLTGISLLLAVAFTAAGSAIAAAWGKSWASLAAGGLFMGLGVSSMHYTGMAAVQMSATIGYDPVLVLASIAIAITASTAALWLTFNLESHRARLIAAAVMSVAVAGMHHTAMRAASFTPTEAWIDLTGPPAVAPEFLALAIGFITVMVMGIGLVSVIVDRRIEERERQNRARLHHTTQSFQLLVQNVTDYAIYMLDPSGRVTSWNRGAERIEGYSREDVIGRHFEMFYPEADRAAGEPRRVLEKALRDGKCMTEGALARKDGSTFLANVIIEPFYDEEGRHVGFSKITRDITERYEYQTALEEARRDLELKVEERTRELQEAKEAAEQANESKSRFLANMSHELRTPLNAIIGYAEMLLEEMEEEGRTQAAADLRRINGAGRHLLSLINDVLDLSKIEARRVTLQPAFFDVGELVRDLADTVTPLAQQRGNRIETRLPPSIPPAYGDQGKVRQCLLNLLGNAMKFTENGIVTLAVSVDAATNGDALVFDVADTGIGMTPEQAAHVFIPFVQADDEVAKTYGGTGLGLAITRELAHVMGGEIGVRSTMGEGSVFTLRLPLNLAEAHAGEPVPSEPAKDAAAARSTAAAGNDPRETIRVAGAVRPGDTVLVIDDDAKSHDLVERWLRRLRYDAVTASSGREGLRRAREIAPAAIVLDVVMPDINGWQVLAELKGDRATRDIPVVVASIIDDRPRATALGAADFLPKPLSFQDFSASFERLARPWDRRHVLLIGTDVASCAALAVPWRGAGYAVETASDPGQAAARAKARRPDLVLVDIGTAESRVPSILGEIMADPALRGIPLVAFPGGTMGEMDSAALAREMRSVLEGMARGPLPMAAANQ
jgi:PAS domain S-box-containing protein